jgi:hypothetical protein
MLKKKINNEKSILMVSILIILFLNSTNWLVNSAIRNAISLYNVIEFYYYIN